METDELAVHSLGSLLNFNPWGSGAHASLPHSSGGVLETCQAHHSAHTEENFKVLGNVTEYLGLSQQLLW